VTIFGIQHDRIVRGRLYMEDVDRSCGNIDQLSGAWPRPPGCLRLPEGAGGCLRCRRGCRHRDTVEELRCRGAPGRRDRIGL